MADDFEKAVLYSFDQSGAVAPDLRDRATSYLQGLQAGRGCVASKRFSVSSSTRDGCKKFSGHCVLHGAAWRTATSAAATSVRKCLCALRAQKPMVLWH